MTMGVELTPTRTIGIGEIEKIAVGASFYACGGGGSLVDGRIMTAALAGRLGGATIGVVTLDELPDAARVAVPSSFARPRSVGSAEAAAAAFSQLAARTGGDFDAVLPADLGVLSVLTACSVALELDLPVVDAGGAMRAAAHLDQTSWAAAGVLPELAVVTDGDEQVTLQSDSVVVADRSLRALVTGDTFGGPVACATWPMRAPTAQRSSIPGLLTAALIAGQAIDAVADEGGDAVAELVRLVDGAVLAGRGRISGVTVALHERMEHFEIRVETANGVLEVRSIDHHLQLRIDDRLVVGAPDLLSIVTPGGVGCTPRDLAVPAMEGQAVAVIAVPVDGPVGVDAMTFADDHRLLGHDGSPIPFSLR